MANHFCNLQFELHPYSQLTIYDPVTNDVIDWGSNDETIILAGTELILPLRSEITPTFNVNYMSSRVAMLYIIMRGVAPPNGSLEVTIKRNDAKVTDHKGRIVVDFVCRLCKGENHSFDPTCCYCSGKGYTTIEDMDKVSKDLENIKQWAESVDFENDLQARWHPPSGWAYGT